MNGGSEKIELTTMLDSDVLEKKMIEIDRKHKKRTGKPLFGIREGIMEYIGDSWLVKK